MPIKLEKSVVLSDELSSQAKEIASLDDDIEKCRKEAAEHLTTAARFLMAAESLIETASVAEGMLDRVKIDFANKVAVNVS